MTVRDVVKIDLEQVLERITTLSDDTDFSKPVREDLRLLARNISAALDGFNQPVGDGPWSDCGPTGADLAGEVQHDVG
jgi:hypothetical protein